MDVKNAMAKHRKSHHPAEQDLKLETRIVKSGFSDNVSRYICEALTIEETQNDPTCTVVNSRSEWGNNPLSRLRVQR